MTSTQLPESLISTLPGRYYTDPGIFALEQATIFEDMWFCAVRGSDIPDAGSFRTVQVGTESLIISRSRRGEVRAFFNVCRHRGAKICTEDSGTVKRAFQCPYHAWTYDLDGKLIAAPNLTKMPDVDRVAYGLRAVHVREWLGYVWVSMADEPPSFEATVEQEIVDRLGEVENLDHYDLASLSLGRRIVYEAHFEPHEWVRTLRDEAVTQAMVVPTMLGRVLAVIEADGQGVPSLRHLSYGGGRMPPASRVSVPGRTRRSRQRLSVVSRPTMPNGAMLNCTSFSSAWCGA